MEFNNNLEEELAHPNSSVHRANMAARGDEELKPKQHKYSPTTDIKDPSKGELVSTSAVKNEPTSFKLKLLNKYGNKFK